MDSFKQVSSPIYEFDELGELQPNPIFHRSWDKLHSRCIEYPYAASRVCNVQRLLDVGTAKADLTWIAWLNSLPLEVHTVDYDPPESKFDNCYFYSADVRYLPIPDDIFDIILAVSVIEHIGLEKPLVKGINLPAISEWGDLDAFKELVRILKPGGNLVMTFPFGVTDNLILDGAARSYTNESIKRFFGIAHPIALDYFEYQYSNYTCLYTEPKTVTPRKQKLREFWKKDKSPHETTRATKLPRLPGQVTWRKIPLEDAKATNTNHIDGVLCSVWSKF
ncbi:MAG: hypothetical protein A2W35_13605 [Chloroflexi bacterium RBG_16_57_11]|nr:MAG: hypothetical protein A2W35_13605 [Chloroflexi bacterium RBG_16_57_11]